jgi:PAS domain S-box-containing protein
MVSPLFGRFELAHKGAMDQSTHIASRTGRRALQRLGGLRLSHKITALVVLVALMAGTVVAVADYRLAAAELRRSAEEKLMALLEARRAAVSDYLASIRLDLRTQATNPLVVDAFRKFEAGWSALGDEAGARLSNAFVRDNPYPPAGRKQLDDPGDGSRYGVVHGRFHPILREFVEQHGYRDLLLIDMRGRVIYSAMKQEDFGTLLNEGPDEGGGLARVFRNIAGDPSTVAESFVDFSRYRPAGGRPTGFVATPLNDETGKRLGVLVFEMPVSRISHVTNVIAGMGRTGEIFVAGGDRLLRSDSRFATRSTILERRVDSRPVNAALNGETGLAISRATDDSGRESKKLAAFAPLDFLGARWAIIAQADLQEVDAPVARMRNRAIMNGVLLALLVAGLGYAVARYSVVAPLSGIADTVQRLTRGETGQPVPSTGRGDEIGDIARALALYKENLSAQQTLAAEHDEIMRTQAVRQRLAEAIEALPDGFILLDPDDRVVLVNSKYREFYAKSGHLLSPGADFGAFLRHHAELGEIVEARGRVDEFVRFQLEEMQPGQVVESRLASGRRLRIADFRLEDGGTVSICSDITDLKSREQALVESEERYRLLVNTLPDGVILHDDDSIRYINPVGRRILGIADDEGCEKYHYRDFVHPEEKAAAEARIRAIVERGEDNPPAERHIRTRDGRDIFIEIAAVPLRRGPEVLALAVFRDLTETKQARAEIERQRDALHQSEKLSALGSLLAGVAHELNNPLSIVVAQAVLMEETNRDEKVIKRAKDIRAAADRCARIVRTFLSMARQQRPERGSVDLNELVGNALELMAYTLRTAGIEVVEHRHKDLPPIWGDGDQLHQVVANLLVNAQHAMMDRPEPRRLTIATGFDRAADMVTLTVDDTGPGVSPDMRKRIFEPFFTTKPTGLGTGIGLSVCHGVVESHGGRISVTDAPGGGARFVVQLPPAGATAAVPAEFSVRSMPDRAKGRILIVDDEPDVADSLAEMLEILGHDVDLADSGAAALRRIADKDYDVILTDLRMPNVDGMTLYRKLEADRPDLCDRVAVVTGDTLEAPAIDFLKENGLPWIEKPFAPADVEKLVEDMLGQTRRLAKS